MMSAREGQGERRLRRSRRKVASRERSRQTVPSQRDGEEDTTRISSGGEDGINDGMDEALRGLQKLGLSRSCSQKLVAAAAAAAAAGGTGRGRSRSAKRGRSSIPQVCFTSKTTSYVHRLVTWLQLLSHIIDHAIVESNQPTCTQRTQQNFSLRRAFFKGCERSTASFFRSTATQSVKGSKTLVSTVDVCRVGQQWIRRSLRTTSILCCVFLSGTHAPSHTSPSGSRTAIHRRVWSKHKYCSVLCVVLISWSKTVLRSAPSLD